MSPTPALFCDRKQRVCQPFLWYGTSGAVSLHRQTQFCCSDALMCLNSIQRKATVICLLLCLHDCYTFRHPCHLHTYAKLHTHTSIYKSVVCDYKVKRKKGLGWYMLSVRISIYMLMDAASWEWEWAPWSGSLWLRCLAQTCTLHVSYPQLRTPMTTVGLI